MALGHPRDAEAAPNSQGEVVLDAERFATLLPSEPDPRPDAPGALVVDRKVTLVPVGDERLGVHAEWRIVVDRPTAVAFRLTEPGIAVDRLEVGGETTQAEVGDDGATVLRTLLTRTTTVSIDGAVTGDPNAGVSFGLLAAGKGSVSFPTGWRVEGAVPISATTAVACGADLRLVKAPARSAGATLVLGETAVGLTVSEATVGVRARVRWRVARGSIDRAAVVVPGVSAAGDLEVSGPQVASWTRDGDRIDVVLRAPERSLAAIALRYSLPTPAGTTARLDVPAVATEGTFRATSVVQVARDAELDVVPELSDRDGWQPRGASSVPEWGRDLVDGAPTASFVGRGGGGSLGVLRFTPADSPATLIDVAEFTAATSDDGRVLMRAHYAVRNDRGAVLRVSPPPGMSPIGARVSGRSVVVARDGDAWLVPLAKSVETVEGLLAFPVEVIWLGEDDAWSRRSHRALALPTVDAQVAVARLSLHLPPGQRPRSRPGHGDVVDAFTEGGGITYGFAVGDVRAAQADALFQSAVDAWMSNDFEHTATILDKLDEMGASNEDIGRMWSNLSVVGVPSADKKKGKETTTYPTNRPAVDTTSTRTGSTTTGTDEITAVLEGADQPPPQTVTEAPAEQDQQALALERRVLEQARARAVADEKAQEEAESKADAARAAGDYAEAESYYRKALDVGKNLAKLRSKEDVAQEEENQVVTEKLRQLEDVVVQKQSAATSNSVAIAGKVAKTPSQRTAPDTDNDGVSDHEDAYDDDEERADDGHREGGQNGTFAERYGGLAGNTRAEPDANEAPKPEAPPPSTGEATSESGGETITDEFVRSVPTGREFEAVVQAAPGKSKPNLFRSGGGGGARGNKDTGVETVYAVPPPPMYMEPPPPAEPVAGAAAEVTGLGPDRQSIRDGRNPLESDAPDPDVAARRVGDGDDRGELEVTAAALAVVIPTIGEVVRYQRLLLPAGTAWEVPVEARARRGAGPRRTR